MARPVKDLTLIAARNGGPFPRETVKNTIDGRWRIVSKCYVRFDATAPDNRSQAGRLS